MSQVSHESKEIDIGQAKAEPPVPVSHLPPDMEEKYVTQMFYILFITNFVVNIDNGVLPACTPIMMDELKLTTE